MAWEWVAPAGSTIVAVAGIGAAVWASKMQREGAVESVREQGRAQRQQTQDDRVYGQALRVYSTLLERVLEAETWGDTAIASLTSAGSPHEPEEDWPPFFSGGPGSDGADSIHWSPRIRQMVEELRVRVLRVNRARLLYRIRLADEQARHREGVQQRPESEFLVLLDRALEARDGLRKIVLEIRDQMSAELRGKSGGEPSDQAYPEDEFEVLARQSWDLTAGVEDDPTPN